MNRRCASISGKRALEILDGLSDSERRASAVRPAPKSAGADCGWTARRALKRRLRLIQPAVIEIRLAQPDQRRSIIRREFQRALECLARRRPIAVS